MSQIQSQTGGAYAQRSSLSQSRSISHYFSISDVDELTDEELVRYVNNLKKQNQVLKLENDILELVIMRVEPNLLYGIQQAMDYASKLRSSSSLNLGFAKSVTSRYFMDANTSKILRTSSRVSTSTKRCDSTFRLTGSINTVIFGSGPKINLHERSELVSTEILLFKQKCEKSRAKAKGHQALLKAKIEEINTRVQNVEKATNSFNQQVIVKGWDKIAQRIPAEAWVKYLTHWIKLCDKNIGKLRLRTSTLSNQYIKHKAQINTKGELSESLRPVDFEKLEIENKGAMAMIENKISQLADLKKMAGDANLNLTIHKKLMMDQNEYLNKVEKDIERKKRQEKEIGKESEIINEQVNVLAAKLEGVKKLRQTYEVPDIIDYVKVKSEMAELRHTVKMLENKFHVQQIELKARNRQLHSMFFN